MFRRHRAGLKPAPTGTERKSMDQRETVRKTNSEVAAVGAGFKPAHRARSIERVAMGGWNEKRNQKFPARGGFQTRPPKDREMTNLPQYRPNPRRNSMRLADYDYALPGVYFVTICTHRRICLFGNVRDGAMHPNALGETVEACWRALPTHYSHVVLDMFVAMPNHMHGILWLRETSQRTTGKRHGLPELIRGLKTFSARRLNGLRHTPGQPLWQRGYYEHIIRNEKSLIGIRDYIETNPLRWEFDEENPANIHPLPRGRVSNPPLQVPTKSMDQRETMKRRIQMVRRRGGFQTRPGGDFIKPIRRNRGHGRSDDSRSRRRNH